MHAMDYQTLAEEIDRIAEIAMRLERPFQQACFEILLRQALDERQGLTGAHPPGPASELSDSWEAEIDPAHLKIVMSKTGASKEELRAVFEIVGGRYVLLKHPKPRTASRAQIEWALLIALRGGVLMGEYLVDIEDVRRTCKDNRCYDGSNFAANFRARKWARFFDGAVSTGAFPVPLSWQGEVELGRLIKSLARQAD
jgi:hypothetical protein